MGTDPNRGVAARCSGCHLPIDRRLGSVQLRGGAYHPSCSLERATRLWVERGIEQFEHLLRRAAI